MDANHPNHLRDLYKLNCLFWPETKVFWTICWFSSSRSRSQLPWPIISIDTTWGTDQEVDDGVSLCLLSILTTSQVGFMFISQGTIDGVTYLHQEIPGNPRISTHVLFPHRDTVKHLIARVIKFNYDETSFRIILIVVKFFLVALWDGEIKS